MDNSFKDKSGFWHNLEYIETPCNDVKAEMELEINSSKNKQFSLKASKFSYKDVLQFIEIYSLEIFEKKFLRKGIGSYLLNFLYAKNNNCNFILSQLQPLDESIISKKQLAHFYNKNNYQVIDSIALRTINKITLKKKQFENMLKENDNRTICDWEYTGKSIYKYII